ncbi:polysaccharide biosynthesis protein [Spirosoma sp.]|uniref:lipopolysaccharide biosynthesis protein n=1 Tax=Spirosoma sp. TaxID=1899569 RepID=UPI00260192E7|nr:polysaccharide biosynthesis protein [Spirosoma sp.]MCX6219057.1 polysaccharide biosynthesis protein [Spirosoma sp.]
MKAVLSQLTNNPSYAKLWHWIKLVSITGTAQVTVQAIGFISGILVIRLLPTQEYALYTLANTMLGTMTVLADGGISTGVMAKGGKVWQDRQRLGEVLATGFNLRKKFAVVSLCIALPILVYLLHHHDASWTMSILIVLALIPAFFTSLSGTLLEIAPKLHQEVAPLQKIQVGVALSRLVLLSLSIFTFPVTFIAILSAGLPQIWANRRIRKISSVFADTTQAINLTDQKEILYMVKRLLPEAIYYCVSGQLTIWLISIYGSTAGVAQAGALGRLPVALTLFTVLFGSLVLPFFSRTPAVKTIVLQQYLKIQAGLVVLGLCIVGGVVLFSGPILTILGPQYTGLTSELIIMMVGSTISFIATSSFFLCTCRGWVINPAISITISIGAIIAGVSIIDVSTLKGIFWLNIFTSIVHLIMHLAYGIHRIVTIKNDAN